MNKKTIQRAIAASMIALSVSGCSWIKSINPWGDGAPPDQVAQANPIPSNSPTLEPMRVTSHDGRVHSHVQDSSGKTITSGYGDCVNIGATLDDPSQTGDCDKQGLKPATDTATSGGEEMVKPAPAPAPAAATPAPMKENGIGAPGIVQDNSVGDPGRATAEVRPSYDIPAAPSYEKISLQGDALFRFGKSDEGSILSEGISKLDSLAAQLAAYNRDSVESITVIGHADRLGKKVANQALSERRAITVKRYLIKNGVDGAVIKTLGKGSSQPIKQCKGTKKTPALVACLLPNRRVEVVIRGVKGS